MNRHAALNRVYRLIWNRVKERWEVASELSSGRGKAGSSRKALLAAALGLSSAQAFGLPTDGQVTSGSGQINQSGNTLTVNQSSQNLAINWQSFGIGSNEGVVFYQPNSSAIALNRVLGQNASEILGSLKANGQVFILNPNGVLFGQGAQVNVGGLVASTLSLSDQDLNAGKYTFSGSSTASIQNAGSITAAQGGYIALIGAKLINTGSMSAEQGSVSLAAGQQVSLQLANGSLLSLTVDKGALQAQIDNGGLIQADGGEVLLTAKAADELSSAVVNTTGIIEARTLESKAGKIELLADMDHGSVNVAGTLDASAPTTGDGGYIDTSAATVKVADGTQVSTLSAQGNTGTWLIDPADYTIAASGGNISGATLSGNLNSTSITLQSTNGTSTATSTGAINVNDTVSWSANTTLTLNAIGNINFNANVTASGKLALQYGQGAVASGNTATYNIASGVKINLKAGNNFSTKLGSDGATNNYRVITTLGVAGSTTGTDLQGINGNLAGNYVLGSDINASSTSTTSWNSGAGFDPIGSANETFSGNFDGLGHVITGLTINRSPTTNVGLFGYSIGNIRNVGLYGGGVTGAQAVGGLVGYNNGGVISNVYAYGMMISGTGSSVGGLIGGSLLGSISNAYSSGLVTGASYVGGLVGENRISSISNAYSLSNVSASGDYVGGLVGINTQGAISNTYAEGGVSGGSNIGGLIGRNESASVSNSHAIGSVSAKGSYVGGLIGYNYYGTISSAYATGSVSAAGIAVGGLVGISDTSRIDATYASGAVSGGADYAGGLVGAAWDGPISNSYATGSATANGYAAGGLVAYSSGGTISSTYATGSVSSSGGVAGGLVGSTSGTVIRNSYWDTQTSIQTSAGGIGLTTAQLQAVLPAGFDSGVWGNAGNQTTPYLVNNPGSVLIATDSSYTLYKVILTAAQLQNVNAELGGNYALAKSIDLAGVSNFRPIGTNGAAFSGTLDGLGFTVNNLTMNLSGQSYIGLFGYNSGTIRNIGLAGGGVRGSSNVGNLAGYNTGTLANVYATGSVSGDNYVGGLVGTNRGTVTLAHATGPVSANGTVGGLVGWNYSGAVNKSYATGAVSGAGMTGGLIGYSFYGSMSSVYATGAVSGDGVYVGGLVGYNYRGAIDSAYAVGSVTGTSSNLGGLVGADSQGTISNAYATGNVSGASSNAGGLIGTADSDTLIGVYAMGAVYSNGGYAGGLVGLNTGGTTASNAYWNVNTTAQAASPVGIGLTTAQLESALPAGFSSSVWGNLGNRTTPYLLSNPGPVLISTDASYTLYQIVFNASQLQAINNSLASNYVLAGNLDLSGISNFTPIGNGDTAFTGKFDGLGYTLSNLTVDRSGTSYVGLFGYTLGTIRNFSLVGGSVKGDTAVGAVAGYNGGAISNVSANLAVSGVEGVGGLVGSMASGASLVSSSASGKVSGTNAVGGLVGALSYASISNGSATGAVSASGLYAGGLVGYDWYGTISGSDARGAVNGSSNYVGGLVGYNYFSTLSNVYATGAVSGSDRVGGLIGFNSSSTLSSAYASGAVTGSANSGGLIGYSVLGSTSNVYATGAVNAGSYAGGLVGRNVSGTISNAYSLGTVSGSSNIGGFAGGNSGTITNSYWNTQTSGQSTSAGGTGLTTAQLEAALPSGFSSSVWGNAGNKTTPYLLSNAGPVLINTDSSTTLYQIVLNAAQLQAINTKLSGNYALGNSIDLAGVSFTPLGSSTSSAFKGKFDGLNFTVSNLTLNRSSSYTGLFGVSSGTIRNLKLTGANITGTSYVGGLVGYNSGSVSDVTLSGTVKGSTYTGGLVGFNAGTLTRVQNSGSVSGLTYTGGLAGYNAGTLSTARSTASVAGKAYTGGLIGTNAGSINLASASGAVAGVNYSGGLIGFNTGNVSNAYATGAVSLNTALGSSTLYTGGLIGYLSGGTVSSVYSTGLVSGSTYSGGLIGYKAGGTVTNGYWDTQRSGKSTSAAGTAMTTAQLQSGLPAGFDASVWSSVSGSDPGLAALSALPAM